MSELTKVRNYMDVVGITHRSQVIENLPEWEKTRLVESLLDDVSKLAETLNVELTFRPLLVTKNTAIKPVDAIEAASELLYRVFVVYHQLGLSSIALPAFNELHESKMSQYSPDGYFKPDMSSLINLTKPAKFFDSEEEST